MSLIPFFSFLLKFCFRVWLKLSERFVDTLGAFSRAATRHLQLHPWGCKGGAAGLRLPGAPWGTDVPTRAGPGGGRACARRACPAPGLLQHSRGEVRPHGPHGFVMVSILISRQMSPCYGLTKVVFKNSEQLGSLS